MSYLDDPRVFFAAERTLLAWNRTSLALMAFGFVIERSGMLIQMLGQQAELAADARFAFWFGLSFVALGVVAAVSAVVQYRSALHSLTASEIPTGYRVNAGAYITLAIALMGAVLTGYLALRGP